MRVRVEPFTSSREHLLAGLAYADLRVRWGMARAFAHGLVPDDPFKGLYLAREQVEALLPLAVGETLWATAEQSNNNGSHGQHEQNGHTAVSYEQQIASSRAHWQARTAATTNNKEETPLRLAQLTHAFQLNDLELDIFLIALLPELDPRYERLFAYLQDDVTQKRPSIDLILNLLTDDFNEKLSARPLLAAHGRLRQQKLLDCFHDGPRTNPTELDMFVRPPTHLVHYLLGEAVLDEALVGCAVWADLAEPVREAQWLSAELHSRLLACTARDTAVCNLAFYGGYGLGQLAAAHSIASQRQEPLLIIDCAQLDWAEQLPQLLRDGRLYGAVLYCKNWDVLLEAHRPPQSVIEALWAYPGIVILAGVQAWQARRVMHLKPLYEVRFPEPAYEERRQIWAHYLQHTAVGNNPDPNDLHNLANHFKFSPGQIADVVATAGHIARWQDEPLDTPHLLTASRTHSNQNLADLATKIKLRHSWHDIILPEDTRQQLQELINQARQRPVVHHAWGFGAKLAGKGISALFTGEPGTGKTMSADIITGELGLDLYKVDLSSLVSKYIGETEKNLERVFTEAATSNAVLFFDEADAIFGKRSEVKDSKDRYANLEISYLLQRMEAYDGIAILATNMRANLDEAFTRRFDFITDFPFPEADAREEIWRIHFPPQAPVADGLDLALLAQRYPVAGGSIRKMVLAAAFLAARAGEPISMSHLFHAARRDYQKMGRLLEESLFV